MVKIKFLFVVFVLSLLVVSCKTYFEGKDLKFHNEIYPVKKQFSVLPDTISVKSY